MNAEQSKFVAVIGHEKEANMATKHQIYDMYFFPVSCKNIHLTSIWL